MKPRTSTVITHVVTVSWTPTAKDGKFGPGGFTTMRGTGAAGLLAYGYEGRRVTVGERLGIPRAAKRIPALTAGLYTCFSIPYALEAYTAYELELTIGGLVATPVWHKPHGRLLGFWIDTATGRDKLARWIEANAKTIDAAIKRRAQIIDDCFVSERERSLREFYEE